MGSFILSRQMQHVVKEEEEEDIFLESRRKERKEEEEWWVDFLFWGFYRGASMFLKISW